MANKLNIELKDKIVIARGKRFLCEGGFGCSPQTSGVKIFGKFIDDKTLNSKGEQYTEFISGYEVEKIVTKK